MLKKIFKIMLFIVAIWVSIVAEENSVPNTVITENPEREVTTVESLPTRDKAKLSLKVNKVVPEEIMGVYEDGTLKVYLEAKTKDGKALLKTRDVKDMSLKAYSGTSGVNQLANLSKTRDIKRAEDIILNTQASKEKTIEIVERDENGVRLAIKDVEEGENVYISVMNGDKVVKSYRIGNITPYEWADAKCWNTDANTFAFKRVVMDSFGVFAYNSKDTSIDWGKQDPAAQGANSLINYFSGDAPARVTRMQIHRTSKKNLIQQDYYFDNGNSIETNILKNGSGFKIHTKANARVLELKEYDGADAFVTIYGSGESVDHNGNNLYVNLDIWGTGGQRFGMWPYTNRGNVIFHKSANSNDIVSSFSRLRLLDVIESKCGLKKDPVQGRYKDINGSIEYVSYDFKADFNSGLDKPGVYFVEDWIGVDVERANAPNEGLGKWTQLRASYNVDIGNSTPIKETRDMYLNNSTEILDYSNDSNKGLSFMVAPISDKNGIAYYKTPVPQNQEYKSTDVKYQAGIWYENKKTNQLVYLKNPPKNGNNFIDDGRNMITIYDEKNGDIVIRVTQEQDQFAKISVTPKETIKSGAEYTFSLIQGRMVGDTLRRMRQVDFTLRYPEVTDVGAVTLELDPRLQQKSKVLGNETQITLSKRVGKWDDNSKNEYDKLIYRDDRIEFGLNTTIKETETVSGRVKNKTTSDNYETFKTANASRDDIAIKKGVKISELINGSNVMISPTIDGIDETENKISNLNIIHRGNDNNIYKSNISMKYKSGLSTDGYSGSGVVDLSKGVLSKKYFYSTDGSVSVANGEQISSTEKENLKMTVSNNFINTHGFVTETTGTNIMDSIEITSKAIQDEKVSADFKNGYVEANIIGNDNQEKLKVRINGSNQLILTKSANIFDFTGDNKLTITYKYKDIILGKFELEVKSTRMTVDMGEITTNLDNRLKQLTNKWMFIGNGATTDTLNSSSKVSGYSDFISVNTEFKNITEENKKFQIKNVESINNNYQLNIVGNYAVTQDSAAIPFQVNNNTKLTIEKFATIDNNSMLVVEKNNNNIKDNTFTLVASSTTGEERAFTGNIKEEYKGNSTGGNIEGSTIRTGAITGKISIDINKATLNNTYNFGAGEGTVNGLNVTVIEGSNLNTTSAIDGKSGNKANFITVNAGSWADGTKGILSKDILEGKISIGVNDKGGLSITKKRDENIEPTRVILEAWYLPEGVNNLKENGARGKSIQLSVIEVTISNIKKEFKPISIKIDKRLEQIADKNWLTLSNKNLHKGIANSISNGVGPYDNFVNIPQGQSFTSDNTDGYILNDVLDINGTKPQGNYYYKHTGTTQEKGEMAIPYKKNDGYTEITLSEFIQLNENSHHAISKSDIATPQVENTFKILATKTSSPSIVYSGKINENYIAKTNGAISESNENGNTIKVGAVAGKASIDLANATTETIYKFSPGLSANQTVNNIVLKMKEGHSLDTTSSLEAIKGNIANALVVKENGSWKSPQIFNDYKNKDISIDILDGKVRIGATQDGGLLISKLTDENIPSTTIVLEAWYSPNGTNLTNGIQLSAFTLTISSLKSDLGTVKVKLDKRLEKQLDGNYNWISLADGKIRSALDGEALPTSYKNFIKIENSFSQDGSYNGEDVIETIESINGKTNLIEKGDYKRTTESENETAFPFKKNGGELKIREFTKFGETTLQVISKKNENLPDNKFANTFSLKARRGNENVLYTGNLEEIWVGVGKGSGVIIGNGTIDLSKAIIGKEYIFAPRTGVLTNNRGDIQPVLNLTTKDTALDTTSEVGTVTGNLANYLAINDGSWKEQDELKYSLQNGAVEVGVADNGGLYIKKLKEVNIDKTITLQPWYKSENVTNGTPINNNQAIKLSEFTLTIKNSVENLGSPTVKVDNRIVEQLKFGNWIKLNNNSITNSLVSQGTTSFGNYEGLVKIEGSFNSNNNSAIIDGIVQINGQKSLTSSNGYTYIGGDNEAAIPYSTGLTLGEFIKLNSESKHLISKGDATTDSGEFNKQNNFSLVATQGENSKVYTGNIQEEYKTKSGVTSGVNFATNGTRKAGALLGTGVLDLSNIKAGENKYEFTPSSKGTVTVDGATLTVNQGQSLDTTSSVGETNVSVANGFVYGVNSKWGVTKAGNIEDLNAKILDEALEIGLTQKGGFYIKKLKDVDIDTTVIMEAYHFSDNGSGGYNTSTNHSAALQLSVFEIKITSLKVDLGTVDVKIDSRLAQLNVNTHKWLRIKDGKIGQTVGNAETGDYSKFMTIDSNSNFSTTGVYNGNDTLNKVEKINGVTPESSLVNDYAFITGDNEAAIYGKNGTTIANFIKLDSSSKFVIALNNVKSDNHTGENKFELTANRTDGTGTKSIRYSGNLQEKYIGRDNTSTNKVQDIATTYDTGNGSMNLIGLPVNKTFKFPTELTNGNELTSEGGEAKILLDEGYKKPLNVAGRVTSTDSSLANVIKITKSDGEYYTATGTQGSQIAKDLTSVGIPLEIGVSTKGGLTIKKVNDNHLPETELKIEAFYSPNNNLNTGNHIKLGEFNLTVKNIMVSLGETSFTVDRRIGEIVSQGEWLFSDGTLKNSQGTVIGKFPELVNASVKNVRLAEAGETKITDIVAIDGNAPTGDYTGGNVKYKHTITGNKKAAFPYGDNVTLDKYNVGIDGNLMVISTKDLATETSTRRVTRDTKANTEVSSTYIARTEEQRYNGTLKEIYVGAGVYSGSGTITFEEEDKGVTYTFPTTYNGETVSATNGDKTLVMTEVSGNLPNGQSAISTSKKIANLIEVSKSGISPRTKNTSNGESTVIDNITFAIGQEGGLKITRGNSVEIDSTSTYKIKFYYKSELENSNSKILLSEFDLTLKPSERVLGDLDFEIDGRYQVARNWLMADGRTFKAFENSNQTLDYSPLIGIGNKDYATKVRNINISQVTISDVKVPGVTSRGDKTVDGTTYAYFSNGNYVKESAIPKNITFGQFVEKAIISKHNKPSSYTDNEFEITGNDGIKYSGNILEEYKENSINSGTGTLAMDSMLLDGVYKFAPGVANPTGILDISTVKDSKQLELVKEIKITTEKSLDPRGRVTGRTDKNIANKIVLTSEALPQDVVLVNNSRINSPEEISVPLKNVPQLLVAMGIDKDGNLLVKKIKHKPINHKVTIKYYYTPNNNTGNPNSNDMLLGTFDLTLTNTINEIELGEQEFKLDERLVNHMKDNSTLSWYRGDKNVISTSKTKKMYDNFIIPANYNITSEYPIIADDIILKEGESNLTLAQQSLDNKQYKMSIGKLGIPIGVTKGDFSSNLIVSTEGMTTGVEAPISMEFTTKDTLYKGVVKRKIMDTYHEARAGLDLAGIAVNNSATWASESNGTPIENNNSWKLTFDNATDKLFNMDSLDGAKGVVTSYSVTLEGHSEASPLNTGKNEAVSLNLNEGTMYDNPYGTNGGTADIKVEIVKSGEKNILKITKLTNEVLPKSAIVTVIPYADEIQLGKLTLVIKNTIEDLGVSTFKVDGRFKNKGTSWLTSKNDNTKGDLTLDSIENSSKKAYYKGLFAIDNTQLKTESTTNIQDVILVEGRDNKGNEVNSTELGASYIVFKDNDEFAMVKSKQISQLKQYLVTSKKNTTDAMTVDNIFYLLGSDNKIYRGNVIEKYLGEVEVPNFSGTIDLSEYTDLATGTVYTFPATVEGTEALGEANGKTSIKMILDESGEIINGLGRVTGENIANSIEVTLNGTTSRGKTVKIDGLTFGISNAGGLTISGLNEEIVDEKVYTIKLFAVPTVENVLSNEENLKVELYTFNLTLKPYAKPLGTIDFKYDARVQQLKNTYSWLAADGSLYNGSGEEQGNYPELLRTKYTPDEKTPEDISADEKVTDVYRINNKGVNDKTIKGYIYSTPTAETTKMAFPSSGTADIFIGDYTQKENPSSKFVISTTNLSTKTGEKDNFIIEALKDNTTNKKVKYKGFLGESIVDTEVPVAGYSGSGKVDVTKLMISKKYEYSPDANGATINPITIDGIAVKEVTSGVITEAQGKMVDARGLFEDNNNRNIATKVIVTAKSNGEKQVLTVSKGRSNSVGVEPVPITAGKLKGAIALGISSTGGLIIEKLDEQFAENEEIVIEYIYDTSKNLLNTTTHNGVVLGNYTLVITNTVEDVGDFTTKVDPRVLQQRTDNNVFWIHTGANIGKDPLANLGGTNNNASELIQTTGNYSDITFPVANGITYIGNGIHPPQYNSKDVFKRFAEGNKAILGIKNDVNTIDLMKVNTAFATYSSENTNSYNIPIILKGNDKNNYKVGAILEYVKDNNKDIPIEGYVGRGILRVEEAEKNITYEFAPKGTSVTKNNITLNIIPTTREANNTMLDASGKVKNNGNIANLMRITVGNEEATTIEKDNNQSLTYKVTQTNSGSLAGDGEVEVGINNDGGLSVKKITNGDFDKTVKIEYFYKFNQKNNTPIEIKLGEVTLQIINEVIELGTVEYDIDGRYYAGAVKKEFYSWLYPDGKATNGLGKGKPTIEYGKDKVFSYNMSGFISLDALATVKKVLEVKDRPYRKGEFTASNDKKYVVYGSQKDSYIDETAIPNGSNSNLKISDIKKYMLGALNNTETKPLLDNIYYILGSDKKIYVGNVKENIVGLQEILTGSGKIDITNIKKDVLHIFKVEDKKSRIENPTDVTKSNNGLEMTYSGNLLDGRGRVGVNSGKTLANKIKIINTGYRGESIKEEVLIGGTTIRVQNVEIGIDSETGGLTIKKLPGKGGIPENSGGLSFDIEYYYDPSTTTNELGTGSVKLGVFHLDIIDYYFEIEGNNKIDFGNMIYQVTTDPEGVQRKYEYFKVKNIYGKKLEFSLKNEENYMRHESNLTDSKTGEVATIPLDVKVSDHIYDDQFKVEAAAKLTKDTPTGNYKGTIEITVTITDDREPLK